MERCGILAKGKKVKLCLKCDVPQTVTVEGMNLIVFVH